MSTNCTKIFQLARLGLAKKSVDLANA